MEDRVALCADTAAEMEDPRAGLRGPAPFGVHDETIRGELEELVARAAEVILHDAAAHRAERRRRDPPVTQRDEELRGVAEFAREQLEVTLIEMIRALRADPPHGLEINLRELGEVTLLDIVEPDEAALAQLPQGSPAALVILRRLLFLAEREINRERLAALLPLAHARDQVVLRDERVHPRENGDDAFRAQRLSQHGLEIAHDDFRHVLVRSDRTGVAIHRGRVLPAVGLGFVHRPEQDRQCDGVFAFAPREEMRRPLAALFRDAVILRQMMKVVLHAMREHVEPLGGVVGGEDAQRFHAAGSSSRYISSQKRSATPGRTLSGGSGSFSTRSRSAISGSL